MLNKSDVKFLVDETIDQLTWAFGGRSQITEDLIQQALLGKLNNTIHGATSLCFIRCCVEAQALHAEYLGEPNPFQWMGVFIDSKLEDKAEEWLLPVPESYQAFW